MGTRKIIINGSHVGAQLDGIGTYIVQLLRQWTAMASGLPFEVHLHERAKQHLEGLIFPENFSVQWIRRRLFGDTDNLRRFLYSNFLAAKNRDSIIFNPSQLEMTFHGARQIVSVQDVIPLTEGRGLTKQHYFCRFAVPRGLARAAAVITPSQATRNALLERWPGVAAKVRVIQHGVRRLPSGEGAPSCGHSRKYVLFAGRIVPHRNIDRLIQAFLKIQDSVEHDLVLAGKVFCELSRPVGNQRIVVRGYVSDAELGALYRGASAFVFPSLIEGFGFPPLEAMTFGCPVVVSREASLPEVCGSAAVFINPRSVDSIAGGMLRVLRDVELRTQLSREGLQRAAELTWESCAREHLRLFEEIAA